MKWEDLEPGDLIVDLDVPGNDHFLLAKDGELGTWLSLVTGDIRVNDTSCPLDSVPLRGWAVYRSLELRATC